MERFLYRLSRSDYNAAVILKGALMFDSESIQGRRIKEDADYEGVRVQFTGYLGRTRAAMQIDIGFGDTVYPKLSLIESPSALGMPRPKLWGYPLRFLWGDS